jgi:hypothetical protein
MIITFQIGFFLEPIYHTIILEKTEIIHKDRTLVKPPIKEFKRKKYIPNIHKKTN